MRVGAGERLRVQGEALAPVARKLLELKVRLDDSGS